MGDAGISQDGGVESSSEDVDDTVNLELFGREKFGVSGDGKDGEARSDEDEAEV